MAERGRTEVESSAKRLRIFLDHRGDLIDYAAPIVGCPSSAEDVVQEAYFRFVPPPGPGTNLRSPVSYLFRIVRNIALDTTRRRASEQRRNELVKVVSDPNAHSPSPEEQSVSRETLDLVTSALKDVPDDARTAFLMKRMDGASFEEIGERLGVSRATAHRLAQRALAHVMMRLQNSGIDLPGSYG